MGVCILRRIQGLQKCTLLVLIFLCLLSRYYPARLLIQQAYTHVGAAAHAHHHTSQKPAQGYTSSASAFRTECLSSTKQAIQQEKRVLIHGDYQEKADGGGDYMVEEMKKVRTLRKRIGSRPPMCQDKCETCFPCEAVKLVPTPTISSSSMQNMAHLDYSNYDPESWKCKCGTRIFNP